MACLRPSPSGRRLSELLEEKQEPFFLDLHLLEKGCSGSLLDGYDTALCSGWPAPGGNDAASVLRRLTSTKKKKNVAAAASGRGKKKKQQKQSPATAGSGLLRLLLSKILHGKAASRTPAALQSFKMVASSSPCSKHLESVKLKADVAEVAAGEEGMEYSDSDDEKQLSPVSVLENPFERPPLHCQSMCSNVQGSPKNAMAIVRELLLEAAYTPALLTQLLTKSDDLILKDAASCDSAVADLDHDNDDDDCYHHRRSPENSHEDGDETAGTSTSWETHRDELVRVSAVVMSEVPTSRLDAAAVQPERRDVGAEVEAAVIEALLRELVMDLESC